MYQMFYFSIPKDAADMTDDELRMESRSARASFAVAAEMGEGISSKENVRFRKVDAQMFVRKVSCPKDVAFHRVETKPL